MAFFSTDVGVIFLITLVKQHTLGFFRPVNEEDVSRANFFTEETHEQGCAEASRGTTYY